MSVSVQFDDTKMQASTPRALFKTRFAAFGAPEMWRPVYVPGEGGRRFLVNTIVEQAEPSPITMVLNWPAALKRR